jgi:hypothetical protein
MILADSHSRSGLYVPEYTANRDPRSTRYLSGFGYNLCLLSLFPALRLIDMNSVLQIGCCINMMQTGLPSALLEFSKVWGNWHVLPGEACNMCRTPAPSPCLVDPQRFERGDRGLGPETIKGTRFTWCCWCRIS